MSKTRRTFKLGDFGAPRTCESSDANGKTSAGAGFVCIRAIPWFAPWLGNQLTAGAYALATESTTADDKTAALKRWTFTTSIPDRQNEKPVILKVREETRSRSAVQVIYNQQTSLPTRMEFADYPNSDPTQRIEVYVLFSDYREEQGLMLPHRIQRFVERTLQLDFQITNISIN